MGAHTARTVRTGHSAGPHGRAQHGAGIYAVCFSNTHSAEAEKQAALAPTWPSLPPHRCSCIAASLASSALLLHRLPPLLRPSKATLLRV